MKKEYAKKEYAIRQRLFNVPEPPSTYDDKLKAMWKRGYKRALQWVLGEDE
ncbi:MAG: hypothetical protein ACE5K4_10925 [Candidatus Hydrothermarchaeota archaeon]